MSNSRYNDRQLAPGPDDLTNKYSEYVFETEIAQPARNSFGHRSGQRQAEEQLWRDPRYSSSFVGGAAIDQNDQYVYEVQQAPDARGRLASGQAMPAWDGVSPESLNAFQGGLSDSVGGPSSWQPHPWQPRAGANTRALAPMRGFHLGERPNPWYPSVIPPVNGGRGRRNVAEIQD